MQLTEIQQAIGKEWNAFLALYKGQMRSQTPEMNLITDYILSQQGKQLRPLITLLSAALCGDVNERSQTGAVMIELVHIGTLLHDDVIDEAKERRGMPSVNERWKAKTAVLIGDFLFARAFQTAMENSAADFMYIITPAILDVGRGEIIQMQRSEMLDTTEQQYFDIITKKTASLLQACAHIGAVSANANDEQVAALKNFGMLAGIAFQIRDDILDYYDHRQTGKQAGNDILERKLTLPLIFALKKADRRTHLMILDLINKAKGKYSNVQAVMDFARRYGGIDYAEEKTAQYAFQAKTALHIFPDSTVKNALLALADYIILRDK